MLRLNDLTVDEFRDLLHDVVDEVLEERLGMLVEPDADLELHPEVAKSLQEYLGSSRRGDDADKVFKLLGYA